MAKKKVEELIESGDLNAAAEEFLAQAEEDVDGGLFLPPSIWVI